MPTAGADAPPPEDRDVLLHLERFLARRDGIDKLLKLSRYAAHLALTSRSRTLTLIGPNLRSFESSVGLSRKALRFGKFLQDVNAFRLHNRNNRNSAPLLFLLLLAYAGEGLYYFLDQLVFLVKSGLLPIPKHQLNKIQYVSAWAELVGYCGSLAIKLGDISRLRLAIEGATDDDKRRQLKEKLVMKWLSVVQDIADAIMAVADVRDGKGALTGPRVLASAGLLSAVISVHKNWCSC